MIPKLKFTVVFVVCAALNAQEQAPPTIRITTRLVQVSVVVHDKKGHAVSGLKKEDFTLFERGGERDIALFTAESEGSEDANPNRHSPLPPGTYSNRSSSGPGQISVILFDSLNTTFADQAGARGQVRRFLHQVRPGDLVAIYSLTNKEVRVLHDFTDDREQLERAIAGYRTSPNATLDMFGTRVSIPTGSAAADRLIAGADRGLSAAYDEFRAQWTLDAMADIAHHVAALPGRKNLIWVSGTFPLAVGVGPAASNPIGGTTAGIPGPDESGVGLTPAQRRIYEKALRATRALTDSSIAIYPVDARGVMVNPMFSASNPNRSSKTEFPPFVPSGQDTAQLLAEGTGGRAFINRNDIDRMIQDAIDDARVTYTLGFYSLEEDWDEKFHDIRIGVNRPGIDVRYRKGFFAVAAPAPAASDLKSEVSSVLDSILEANSIGLSAQVNPLSPKEFGLSLNVPAGDVYLAQQNGRWVGALEMVFAQIAPDGRRLVETRQPLALNFSQQDYEKLLQGGLGFTKTINAVPDAEVLKIVAVDSSTGHIGSLRIPLKSK